MTAPLRTKPEAAPPPRRLRQDLDISTAAYDISGDCGTIIHDPLRHKFFHLSSSAAEFLHYFKEGAASADPKDEEHFGAVANFLKQSRLLESTTDDQAGLLQEFERSQKSILSKLTHGYISFRIPLFNPEPFLDLTLPFAKMLVGRTIAIVLIILAIVGIYFTGRQWDQFTQAFVASFSVSGATSYALTVVVLKIFHELGHAYVARHFGCRVPLVGITFMVMVPMLFTDASDAWRLRSHWQRFAIGVAGVTVELALAAIAIFFWAFLPDGNARSLMFFVAVTAWIMSVMVNLSPFMRFDGYHMLVDAIGMHSLAPRAFKLANWFWREVLFKPNDPPPEFFKPSLRNALIGFAVGTMLYRLSLFLGIAWLVYTTLPKAIGIPMAAIEVWFFILMPVYRELKEWMAMELPKKWNRTRMITSMAGITFVFLMLILPLDRHVSVPAVVFPVEEAWIYPPENAEIVAIHAQAGDQVVKNQILVELSVSDIQNSLRLAELRLAVVDEKMSRIAADAKDLASVLVLQKDREAIEREISGLVARRELLTIRAPISGVLSREASLLHNGMWVGNSDLLFHVYSPQSTVITGMVIEREVGRIARNADAVFIAEDGAHAAIAAVVKDIGMPGGEGKAQKYLSSLYGGVIEVPPPASGQPQIATGHLPVLLSTAHAAEQSALVGTLTIDATPQSFLSMAFGRVVTVILRESGF